MPTSILSPLVGHQITTADQIHDYVQLKFDNGDVLNVFNEYVVNGAGVSGIHALIGQRVVTVHTQPNEVRIKLGELSFSVSLLEKAYRGPEAIEYIKSSGSRVVWS
jgi:hypothetical protein